MKEALQLIAILSLVNATVIICFQMWGIYDWFNTYRPAWLKWLKDCLFCYGFRYAVYECLALSFFIESWHLLYVPFAAAAITSFLINTILRNEH